MAASPPPVEPMALAAPRPPRRHLRHRVRAQRPCRRRCVCARWLRWSSSRARTSRCWRASSTCPKASRTGRRSPRRSRPWHDPNSVRPEILLTDDPPRHTAVRPVIATALSPKALAKMATDFNADADALAARGEGAQRQSDRCGHRDLAALRLQGAARPARTATGGSRKPDGVRPHGVGHDSDRRTRCSTRPWRMSAR